MSRDPTTSAGCRSMVRNRVSTPSSPATGTHRLRSQNERGSFTTICRPWSWVPNQSASSSRNDAFAHVGCMSS